MRIFKPISLIFKLGILASFILGIFVVIILEAKLPSVDHLKDVQLQVPLRIYTSDEKLIAEFGDKRRTPIKIEEVPQDLINALIATEDIRFYSHPGVDLKGLARAALLLISNGKKQQGGSTITMQVARNFFLTRKKTYIRKINEILLALKIEKELSKEEILELYLNKIYLGKRAYGIAAAAEVYYGTTIDKLNLSQMAMIAGLPQAPSGKNPLSNPKGALKRRNHVLKRMLHYKFIDDKQYIAASSAPISAKYHGRIRDLDAPYISEMVRQQLVEAYGESVYSQGLSIYTTIDSKAQKAANNALTRSILEYDKRHGYRGNIANFDFPEPKASDDSLEENEDPEVTEVDLLSATFDDWLERLQEFPTVNILNPAVVIQVGDNDSQIILQDGSIQSINFKHMKWAGKALKNKKVGKKPKKPSDVLTMGDVIYVKKEKNNQYSLAQIPEIEGAIIAMNPKSGDILSLVGGFDFYQSKFNRVTQAERQPGSSFKPFVYSAALEHGFTAASIINDAPIVEEDPSGEFDWRPQNHTLKFNGPTRIREGIIKSRNLVSIRLLKEVGLKPTIEFLTKLGFQQQALPQGLSLALGSGEISPIDLATAYSVFPNGGFKIKPNLIKKIVDYNDKVIYKYKPPVICEEKCTEEENIDLYAETIAPRVMTPQTAYIMSSMLQDAIQYGTGKKAKRLKRKDIGGKTGSTNDHHDAWYAGFNQNLVVTTWMGFDNPHPMQEYASTTSLPMWIYFMEKVLPKYQEEYALQPENLVTVKIDPKTGLIARDNQKNAMYEVFTEDTVPTEFAPDYSTNSAATSNNIEKENSLF